MRYFALLPIVVASWAGPVRAVDVVVLRDGDRLSGTVEKLEKGKLFFQSSYAEAPLHIDWSRVTSLTTESEIEMTLQDGTGQTGQLVAAAGGLALLASGGIRTFASSSIVALAPKSAEQPEAAAGRIRRAWDNSSFSADFGQSYSGLSGYNQVSSNTEFEYKGDRWDGTLVTHYDYYSGTDSAGSTYQAYGRTLAQRYIGGDHFFLFPYGFLGRQTSSDGGKGQLKQYGGGGGWTFRRGKPDQVSLYAGLVRSIGAGFTMVSEDLRADARITDTLFIAAASWNRNLKNRIATSLRLYYFKPLTEAGHHAMATDASLKIPLVGPAYFTIRAYDTPELRQRHLFSVKNLQVSSGIGIEF